MCHNIIQSGFYMYCIAQSVTPYSYHFRQKDTQRSLNNTYTNIPMFPFVFCTFHILHNFHLFYLSNHEHDKYCAWLQIELLKCL